MELYYSLPIILHLTYNLIRHNIDMEIITFCWRTLYKAGYPETTTNIRGRQCIRNYTAENVFGITGQTMYSEFFMQIIPKSNLLQTSVNTMYFGSE
jgi:hypothetical protein